ncbi:hypothetical protein D3C75_967390 [compost metagenome]
MAHHLYQTWEENFVVRAEQTLRTQNRKARVRIRLCQQLNHFFAGGFAAGKFVGKAHRTEVLADIAMMVIIKIE